MSWLVKQSFKRMQSGDLIGIGKTIAWSIRERYCERFYGIRSSAPVPAAELGTDTSLSEDYDPTSYLILSKTFRRLWSGGRNNDHGFLDVGCGKGRVTRVAAAYPYRHVLGIEVSPDLAQIARDNFARCSGKKACPNVEIVVADAASFVIPDTVGTVFMYNPFRGATMDRFMHNLHESFIRMRRQITVVFVNPIRFEAARYPWISTIEQFHCFYPHYDHAMKVAMYAVIPATRRIV